MRPLHTLLPTFAPATPAMPMEAVVGLVASLGDDYPAEAPDGGFDGAGGAFEGDGGIFAGAYPDAPETGYAGFGVVGFQGSKRRYSAQIVDEMERRWGKAATWGHFYDCCAGSGQVSLEVRRRAPKLPITLVDMGPWGKFWSTFVAQPAAVEAALAKLLPEGTGRGTACRRLLGKMPSTGGKGAAEFLVVVGGAYLTRLPTAGSDPGKRLPWRTSCVAASGGYGAEKPLSSLRLLRSGPLKALNSDAARTPFAAKAVVYVDPDYVGTAGYRGNTCDVAALVRHARSRGVRHIAISHDKPYPGVTGQLVTIDKSRCLRTQNAKGGVCRPEVLIFPQ